MAALQVKTIFEVLIFTDLLKHVKRIEVLEIIEM